MMGQQGMMGMHPTAAMMYSSSLAATNDGGVVVLIGNKLTKYDNDLNVVKEVEVKIDWENWQNIRAAAAAKDDDEQSEYDDRRPIGVKLIPISVFKKLII